MNEERKEVRVEFFPAEGRAQFKNFRQNQLEAQVVLSAMSSLVEPFEKTFLLTVRRSRNELIEI